MARDILKTLQTEHDTVRALFDKINDTTDRAAKTRGGLLEDIEDALIPHAKWEELVFYPAFKQRADRDGLKTHAEAVAEHHAVEQKVFGELVEHHAGEEEKTLFKMARGMFSAEERASLDEQYEQWKDSSEARAIVAREKAKAGLKSVVRPSS